MNQHALLIRPETPVDAGAIDALTERAFRTAPHSSHTEHHIVRALRTAYALTLSLVAQLDGAVAGHVALSPVTLSDGSGGWFGLGPISVSPPLQGRAIGSRLMRAALAALRERGAAGCVLLGDPAFYGRFGFAARPELVLPDVPPQYFLALAFGAAPWPRGKVAFHAAFEARS